jgi:hypothetical protein
VVIRYAAGERDGRPLFTDALGDLVDLGDRELTVRTRAGLVTVPVEKVVAGKRVPPPPPRRAPRV